MWDFHWQQMYVYDTPIRVAREEGSLTLTCTYDTTSRTEVVRWGENTDDEMCLAYFYVTQ